MDIFFADPNDIPLPPEEVKIIKLEALPYPDGQRVAVRFEITPFQQKPNLEISILSAKRANVASLSVVEVMEKQMDFTMHLREQNPGGKYKVTMRLFYTDLDRFELKDRESAKAEEILMEVGQTIDNAETEFEISGEAG